MSTVKNVMVSSKWLELFSQKEFEIDIMLSQLESKGNMQKITSRIRSASILWFPNRSPSGHQMVTKWSPSGHQVIWLKCFWVTWILFGRLYQSWFSISWAFVIMQKNLNLCKPILQQLYSVTNAMGLKRLIWNADKIFYVDVLILYSIQNLQTHIIDAHLCMELDLMAVQWMQVQIFGCTRICCDPLTILGIFF